MLINLSEQLEREKNKISQKGKVISIAIEMKIVRNQLHSIIIYVLLSDYLTHLCPDSFPRRFSWHILR